MAQFSPIGWAFRPLQRYADFSGRSSRAELWWFMLAMLVLWIAVSILLFGALAGLGSSQTEPSSGLVGVLGIGWLFIVVCSLALIVPTLAVQVRRLHDTDRSGWWLGGFYLLYAVYAVFAMRLVFSAMAAAQAGSPPAGLVAMGTGMGLIGLAQFAYTILLIVFYCLPGTTGPNRFGPDPYGRDKFDEIFA